MKICELIMPRFGEAKIDSPIYGPFVPDTLIPLHLGGEFFDGIDNDTIKSCSPVYMEQAGPREKIYYDPSKVKAAIVTCGGLCPGLNDVIRAIVMELHHAYGISSVFGVRYGLEGFIPEYQHEIMELTLKSVSEIHTFGGTILGTSRGPQKVDDVVDALERMNINIIFMLGGDGTMKAALGIQREVQKRGLKISVIGVPKTIDNDINFVPRSFGFETAVDAATHALACAHTEASGLHNGIGLVKLMGRESGFIAAHAALSYNVVNFLLVPETPFTMYDAGGLLPELEERLKNRRHAVIVVAEGAGQHLIPKTGKTDSSGNVILQDVGIFLKEEITKYFKERNIVTSVKYIDPSYIVRAIPANSGDRVYCGFLGRHAVHAAMSGRNETVIAKIMDRYVHVPMEFVTGRRRRLDIGSAYWRTALASTGQARMKGMLPESM